MSILNALKTDPDALASAATAHCAILSALKNTIPAPALSLHPYHLRPSFLWAPHEARCAVFKWARNAFIAQLAASTKAYVKLIDDCAGDVLEFLEVAMTRQESMHVTTHCASLKARDWVRAVLVAAVAVSTTPVIPLSRQAPLLVANFSSLLIFLASLLVVDHLLSFFLPFVSCMQDDLDYPLFFAAECGNVAIVKDCLANGANVEKAENFSPVRSHFFVMCVIG